jgi:hypothetical protein
MLRWPETLSFKLVMWSHSRAHYYENCGLTKAFHEALRSSHSAFYCIFKNKRVWSIEKTALTVVKIIPTPERWTSMLVALVDLWLSWELHLSKRLPCRLRTNALVAACQFWVTNSTPIRNSGILFTYLSCGIYNWWLMKAEFLVCLNPF